MLFGCMYTSRGGTVVGSLSCLLVLLPFQLSLALLVFLLLLHPSHQCLLFFVFFISVLPLRLSQVSIRLHKRQVAKALLHLLRLQLLFFRGKIFALLITAVLPRLVYVHSKHPTASSETSQLFLLLHLLLFLLFVGEKRICLLVQEETLPSSLSERMKAVDFVKEAAASPVFFCRFRSELYVQASFAPIPPSLSLRMSQ